MSVPILMMHWNVQQSCSKCEKLSFFIGVLQFTTSIFCAKIDADTQAFACPLCRGSFLQNRRRSWLN